MDLYKNQQKEIIKQLRKESQNIISAGTRVPMQKDYLKDKKRCLTSVTFLNSEIAEEIYNKIIIPLKTIEPWHYYMPRESMHITIKNIKYLADPPLFSKQDIIKVDKLYKNIIPKLSSFDFTLEDLVMLNTSLMLIGYSNKTLQKVVKTIDKNLNEIGVPDNKTYISDEVFFGNITLCRFTKPPGKNFIKKVNELKNIKIGKFRIQNVVLVETIAVLHPDYTNKIGKYYFKKFDKK